MNTDNLITPEGLARSLKMAAEGMKKKPGLMKSAVPHMELIYKYVNNIVTAKENGRSCPSSTRTCRSPFPMCSRA